MSRGASAAQRARLAGAALLRAVDPRLTAQLRVERQRSAALSARLRPGSSIAVVGIPPRAGRSTVAALVALALARYQRPRVLAVDTDRAGGLHARLAVRLGGSAHPVLVALGVRADPAGSQQARAGHRWLRQQLAAVDQVMLLAGDHPRPEPPVAAHEYAAALDALCRWFPVAVTDTPRLSDDPLLPAVLARADRVVIVGPDDEREIDWFGACLPWIAGLVRQPLDRITTGALVQQTAASSASRRPAANALPFPVFALPYDPALAGARRLEWRELAPRTRQTVCSLAAYLVRGLGVGGPG